MNYKQAMVYWAIDMFDKSPGKSFGIENWAIGMMVKT